MTKTQCPYTAVDFDTMRRCALRELNYRQKFYPIWVKENKMPQTKADIELQGMKLIYDFFCWQQLHPDRTTQLSLF